MDVGRVEFACEFCGATAVPDRVILTPGEVKGSGRDKKIIQHKYAYVCETHKRAIEDGKGWQEREKQRREDWIQRERERMIRDQTALF